MLRPSPPDSVQSSTGTRSRKLGDRGILVRAAQAAVEARESDAGLRASRSARQRKRLARVDEDQLLLRRVAPQQIEQRRLLAAGARAPPSARPSAASPDRRGGARRSAPARRGRGGRRSGGSQQVVQRQPLRAARAVGRKPAHGGRQIGVGLGSPPRPPSTRIVDAWRRGSFSATTARVLRIIAPRISSRRRSGLAGWRGLPGVM